ncbi:hypothetical protein GCM10022243_54320 [Saccharothrix violaceirubra]|uniref:HEAT repeat protein n=1 Tax=Saccharothrix violaceirubra TaxID=413306 RepID=A0A7W7WXB5_9PSEU|nr:HEAT repeat domain-containing protein [Saccharothrix violaceirubra]MBB4966946.1 hypothetical protein [Saccharothrix violaceirubra]
MDAIDWAALEHNYGNASDIPDLLRRCADEDADTASEAAEDLFNLLYHQGGWVCSAASAALPFLADLAATAAHHRAGIVGLIDQVAAEAHRVESRFVDDGWQAALDATRHRLLALLDDPDARVRGAATMVAARGIRHPDSVAALRRRWLVETDRVTRWDLAHALGKVHAWHDDDRLRAEVDALIEADDPHLRLAAAHASADPTLAARHVDVLVEAVRHPDAGLWQESAWLGGGPEVVVRATGSLVRDDPAAAAAYVVGLGRSRPVAAVREAWLTLETWHAGIDAIPAFLADHLEHDLPEVRYGAAFAFGCLGVGGHTDRLAALAGDPARRDSRVVSTVGDAAVWALARQGDPRCVTGLTERLTGDRLGFAPAESSHGPGVPTLWLPGIRTVLIPLREHAEHLVDALATRLAAAHDDHVLANSLCRVVQEWGPAAAAALPAVVAVLDDDRIFTQAAKAIGAVGTPVAVDALRRRADEPAAAWALWRTGGEPGPVVDVLTRHEDCALLADLGPLASAAADTVRRLTRSENDWVRVAAAFALWRITDDPTGPAAVLTDIARPLATGDVLPVRIVALKHLADMDIRTEPVAALAQSIADDPRRIAYSGGWQAFTEDETLRTAASRLLGRL